MKGSYKTESKRSVEEQGISVVRSRLYNVLSLCFLYPDQTIVAEISGASFGNLLMSSIRALYGKYRLRREAERFARVLRGLRGGSSTDLEAEYNSLFAPASSQSTPIFETEYGGGHIFAKTADLADIGGFYKAFGLRLSSNSKERLDHIAVELEFMRVLTLKEAYAQTKSWLDKATICVEAERKFLSDHLGKWAPSFLKLVKSSSRHPYYAALADLALKFVEEEIRTLEAEPRERLKPRREEKPQDLECGAMYGEDAGLLNP